MDIFVLPSIQEGLGLAVCEAMAMNVPVIASNVGGLAELLDEGRCGTLIQPASGADIAKALTDFFTYPEKMQEKTKAANERVRTMHSLNQMTEQLEQLYRGLPNK